MYLFRKLIFFLSIALTIIIIREFISLYSDLRSIDAYWGYAFLIFLGIVFIYFVVIPLIKVLLLPSSFAPVKNIDEREKIIEKRLARFKKNKYLQDYDFDKPRSPEEHYQEIITILEGRAKQVRQQYVSKVFYGTSVSQNGFIDAIIILSAGINLIREIFTIYNGRVSNKDLLRIGRKIYTAMAIGGSEGVEYATDEIITSFAYDGIKSIPFIDKIMGSLADGFVSSMLITRISFIAENYCKIVYLPNDRALVPPQKVIYDTTNSITSDVRYRIKMVLKNLSADKNDVYTKLAVNPAAYVIKTAINKFGKQLDGRTKTNVSGALRMASHPVGFVMDKIITRFKKKKSTLPK